MTTYPLLYTIKVCPQPNPNNWNTIPVTALDDESFTFGTGRGVVTLRDEDLKPDKRGRVIIDLAPIDLKWYFPNDKIPTTFEMPKDVLEARKETRRLKALAKDAIFIDYSRDPCMYFYTEGDQLRILHGEKEIVVDVELIHGRAAVNVDALEIGKSYLELPEEVASKYKRVLAERRLQKASLVLVGKNLLNGKDYFRLSQSIPETYWPLVKSYFEFFEGGEGDLDGWLTCEPSRVARALRLPIP